MQDRLFQSEEFGFPAQATATLIFICPYGTPVEKVRFAIRRLLRAGYHVVAYQTTAAVFTDADPLILPELFNTGGNIALGVWNMAELRQLHEARGWSLPRLEETWAALQYPDFGRLDGCRYVFASSRRDTIAPLGNIPDYLEPMLEAGAKVSVYEVPAVSHRTTVIAGLWKAPHLVRMVRSGR